MAANDRMRALIGSWDQVSRRAMIPPLQRNIFAFVQVGCENLDEFFKEMSVGAAMRLLGRNIHPRLVISENNGQWTVKSEMMFKSQSITFTPNAQFNDTMPDGMEIQVSNR